MRVLLALGCMLAASASGQVPCFPARLIPDSSILAGSFFGPPFVQPYPFFPFYLDGYSYNYGWGPGVVIMQQFSAPAPQVVSQPARPESARPERPRPEIREYNPPAAALNTFAIALNNGVTADAVAVWVHDGVLHYVDRNDEFCQVPLNAVNRRETENLNRARNLTLELPPSSR